MRRLLLLLPLTIPLAACDGEGPDDDTEFRAKPVGDAIISVHLGEGTANDECLIWDVDDGSTYNGKAEDGDVLLTFADGIIYDGSGDPVCEHVADTLTGDEVVVGGANEVLFTLHKRAVYQGEPDFSLSGTALKAELESRLLYSFHKDHVYVGAHQDRDILVTATQSVARMSDFHKLLITALVEGECGSAGLPY